MQQNCKNRYFWCIQKGAEVTVALSTLSYEANLSLKHTDVILAMI